MQNYYVTQQFYSWVDTPDNQKQKLDGFTVPVFPAARSGNNPSVHRWMNGQTKCGLYTYNVELFGLQEEGNSDPYYHIEEP